MVARNIAMALSMSYSRARRYRRRSYAVRLQSCGCEFRSELLRGAGRKRAFSDANAALGFKHVSMNRHKILA